MDSAKERFNLDLNKLLLYKHTYCSRLILKVHVALSLYEKNRSPGTQQCKNRADLTGHDEMVAGGSCLLYRRV